MSLLYKSLILGSSPTAYYRLGESSGTTATDTSGNGYNGTYTGSGVTYSVAGAIVGDSNTAVTFNGSTGDMAMPSGVNPAGWSTLSIEFWVKLSTLTLSTSPAVVANDVPGTNHKGVAIYFNSNATALNFAIGTGSAATTCTGNFTFATSTWYHVCCTWDGATMTIYVNGVSKGTASFAGPIGSTTNNVYVAHNPGGTDFFTGSVDEVAVYNAALLPATVLNHYNTAVQADTSLYTVSNGADIFTTDSNQVIKVLQQVAGGQEKGGYVLSGNVYVANGYISLYVETLSRGSTPVSVSVDTTDVSPPAYFSSISTGHLTSGGFQIFCQYTSINAGGVAAGKYTVQY